MPGVGTLDVVVSARAQSYVARTNTVARAQSIEEQRRWLPSGRRVVTLGAATLCGRHPAWLTLARQHELTAGSALLVVMTRFLTAFSGMK